MKGAAERAHDVGTEEMQRRGDGSDDADGECEERFSCEHEPKRNGPRLNVS